VLWVWVYMSLRNSAYLEQVRPVSWGYREEIGGERYVHGLADIILVPASPARAAAVPTGEGEGEAAYVNALASHWSGFIHVF
jgi:hypothetical protein